MKKFLCFFLAFIFILPGTMVPAAAKADVLSEAEAFERDLAALREDFYDSVAPEAMNLETIYIQDNLPHREPIYTEPDPATEGELITAMYDVAPPGGIGSTRNMYFNDTPTTATPCKLIAQSDYTNIWVRTTKNLDSTQMIDAQNLAIGFDAIYKRMTGEGGDTDGFAAHKGVTITTGGVNSNMPVIGDVDGDDRINYFFYEMSAGGFFSNGDFFNTRNQLDMVNINVMYLDNYLSNPSSSSYKYGIYGVMAHEFQHLLFYMYFGVYADNSNRQFSWINEAMSALVQTLYLEPNAIVYPTAAVQNSRLSSSVVNSYQDSGYGDFLRFNNSSKNYGIVQMFSVLMFRKYGIEYAQGIYDNMRSEYPMATSSDARSANQIKLTKYGHDVAVSKFLHGGTGVGDGENTLQLLYTLFMENFAADGGTLHTDPAAGTTKFLTATDTNSNMWSRRAATTYPTLNSGGTVSLAGYGTQPSGTKATHEMLYKLAGGSVSAPILTITAPADGNPTTLYYVAIPRASAADGADVYPLTKGILAAINTAGRDAYLFVSTFHQNVGVPGPVYAWRGASDAEAVEGDIDWLTWNVIKNQNIVQNTVRTDLTLPASGPLGSTITWASGTPAVITTAGAVDRSSLAANQAVTLTATVAKNSGAGSAASKDKGFSLTVWRHLTAAQAVAETKDEWLTWDVIKGGNAVPDNVTVNLVLPAQGPEANIAWSSGNQSVISANGWVNPPGIGEDDAVVTLTATITKTFGGDSASETKEFTLTVKAKTGGVVVPSLNSALDIDLASESINLRGYQVKAYSLNGGKKWKKGSLPEGDKFAKLLNKELELWLSDVWIDKVSKAQKQAGVKKGVPEEHPAIVKFPVISKRPTQDKLVAYFPQQRFNSFYMVKKGSDEQVTAGYEFANTANGKTPNEDGWTPLGSFMVESGKAKKVLLLRAAPVASGGIYIPAGKPFKVKPATFGKVPKAKADNKKKIINLKKGEAYSTVSPYGSYTFLSSKTTLQLSELGAPGSTVNLYVMKAPTGKKPRTEIQTLSVKIPEEADS